jgi:predicted dehydrogenase
VPLALWGDRSREWAGGSSTAHFLLSHVSDLLRWNFAPAEVKEVFAIVGKEVLGFTPDVYDAYLMFDNGLKVRVKAEWIKHIDNLVEFYQCFSGAEGTLIYNKRGGFATETGWRANLAASVTPEQLLAHQNALLAMGANVRAILHRPSPPAGQLATAGGDLTPALEYIGNCSIGLAVMDEHFVNAILGGTAEPKSWVGRGPLPNHVDGLKQTQIVAAIIKSSETGKVVEVK